MDIIGTSKTAVRRYVIDTEEGVRVCVSVCVCVRV